MIDVQHLKKSERSASNWIFPRWREKIKITLTKVFEIQVLVQVCDKTKNSFLHYLEIATPRLMADVVRGSNLWRGLPIQACRGYDFIATSFEKIKFY